MRRIGDLHRDSAKLDQVVSWLMLVFVVSSFCFHYYVYLIKSYVFYSCVLAAAAVMILYLCRKRFESSVFSVCILWYVAAFVVCIHILRTPFDINTYIDAVAFAAGCVLIGCSGTNKAVFDKVFRVIVAFALFFAVTLWIQVLLPRLYAQLLYIFPIKVRIYVYELEIAGLGYTGLTVNPGFTAAHMIAGMFAVGADLCQGRGKRRTRIAAWAVLVFLFVSLLMTGKRGPLLFVACTLVLLVFLSLEKKGRKRMLLVLGLGCMLMVIAAIAFGDLLRTLPVIDRLFRTVEGLFSGADISNNRSGLYTLAWQLAQEHPVFGIGWNQFRKATVGTVTIHNELDVHNIYLQMFCEIGVVGLLIVLAAMVVFWFVTCRAIIRIPTGTKEGLDTWKRALGFSFAYQTYFLIYGMTENPLYDHNYILLYFVSCSVTAAFMRRQRGIEAEEARRERCVLHLREGWSRLTGRGRNDVDAGR